MKHVLRKHGNVIMAVLGILLMGAFSLPSYMKNAGDTSTVPVGTLNGKTVTSGQVNSAKADIQILQMFHVPVAGVVNILDPQNQDVHWYLLLREATAYGIAPSEADITEQVSALGATEDLLNQALSGHGLTQNDLRAAIGHGLMIYRLVNLTSESTVWSVPQLEMFAEYQYSKLQVRYFALNASDATAAGFSPSEDALKKQFDLYKGVIPASISGSAPPEINGHHYPFGYKYADRVMVEYIKFERQWLRQHFKPTQADFEEAYRYYTTHQAEFPNEKATGTQPAIKPFDNVSNQLVQQQVDARINAFIKKMTESARDMASAPWKDAETDKGFRKGVMDKGAAGLVSYDDIVKAIGSNPEYEGYKVVHGTHTDWLDKAGLTALLGIGSARFTTQSGEFGFADLALHVKELDPAQGPMTRLFLQEGVEGPLVSDDDGNVYMYRVIKAEKSHEPASVQEVRGQVVLDLAKTAAYENKEAQGKALAAAVAKSGIDAAAGQAGTRADVTDPLTRNSRGNNAVEPAPGFIDAAFTLVGTSSATQPASSATVLNDDADLKVYVIGGAKYVPIAPKDYGMLRTEIVSHSAMFGQRFALDWLSLEQVAKRMKYVPIEPFKEKEAG